MERRHLPGLVAFHARDPVLRGDQGYVVARLAAQALEVIYVGGGVVGVLLERRY